MEQGCLCCVGRIKMTSWNVCNHHLKIEQNYKWLNFNKIFNRFYNIYFWTWSVWLWPNRPFFTRDWTNSEPYSQFHDYHLMHAFTWDTWNWTNSNTANPSNSCVANGTERICVFVRYCANIVLNIIKCSQSRSQALPSYGEKTRLVGAGHVTHRKWIAVGNVPLVQSGFEFWKYRFSVSFDKIWNRFES
jgi:hypothetical protein